MSEAPPDPENKVRSKDRRHEQPENERVNDMALKDLERYLGELEELAVLLKAETKPLARRVIMGRVQEIYLALAQAA